MYITFLFVVVHGIVAHAFNIDEELVVILILPIFKLSLSGVSKSIIHNNCALQSVRKILEPESPGSSRETLLDSEATRTSLIESVPSDYSSVPGRMSVTYVLEGACCKDLRAGFINL